MKEKLERGPTPIQRTDSSEAILPLKEVITLLKQKKWFLILAPTFVVCLLSVVYSLRPLYAVKSHLLLDTEQESSRLNSLLSSLNSEGGTRLETEMEKNLLMLEADYFVEKVASNLIARPDFETLKPLIIIQQRGLVGTLKEYIPFLPSSTLTDEQLKNPRTLAGLVRGSVRVKSRNPSIIEVKTSTANRELTATLSNVFLDTATNTFSERENTKLQSAKNYIEAKIDETMRKMERADRGALSVSKENPFLLSSTDQNDVAERLGTLKNDINKFTLQLEQNKKMIATFKARLGADSANRASTADAGLPATPAAYGMEKTIANLEAENELISIQIDTMRAGLKEAEAANRNLPKDAQLVGDLKRMKMLHAQVFENLSKTLLQVEVRGLSLLNRIYPLEMISLHQVGAGRNIRFNLIMAFVASWVITALLIIVNFLVNPVVRSKKDLEALPVSVVGTIPRIGANYLETIRSTAGGICRFDIDSPETIPFKQVRTRLSHLMRYSGTETRKTVAFLSSEQGAGKSFLTSNLAASFAHAGQKTLLVDFDLRRGFLTKNFKLSDKPGIAGYLEGNRDLKDLITKNVIPNLDLLPAGPFTVRTAEFVTNVRFLRLLEEVKQDYDIVCVDTAPLSVSPESSVVAREVDFPILISTSWKTKKEHLMESIDNIRQFRKSRLYCLVNMSLEETTHLAGAYYYNLGGKISGALTS